MRQRPVDLKECCPKPHIDGVEATKDRLQIVNFADLSDANWTFLQASLVDLQLDWHFFSTNPRSPLERLVKRPRLARWRGVWAAVRCAARNPHTVVISHLPKTTLWLVLLCSMLSVKARHIAFSFNFTELPTGIKKDLMRWAFRKVDRFVVFSRTEQSRYADYFGIDLARIDFMPWEMDIPRTSESPFISGKYVCAVGGEGRDYETLIRAMQLAPHIKTVIVTRSYNMPQGPLPANVELHTELSGTDFWSVVKHSHAVVVPLLDAQTNCGHITLVGALLFGRPIVATRSAGIDDYVTDDVNALIVAAGDALALQCAVERIWSDQLTHERLRANILSKQTERPTEGSWNSYFRQYLSRFTDR